MEASGSSAPGRARSLVLGDQEASVMSPDSLITQVLVTCHMSRVTCHVSRVTQEHSVQLVDNLRRIYDEEDCFLHDVTLVSSDKGEVRAHKIILAAQSDYFKVSCCPSTLQKVTLSIVSC